MSKKNEVEKLKEIMHEGMIKAFEQDGALTPVLFYHQKGEPTLTEIPPYLLNSGMGKTILTEFIRSICVEPTTLCAGLVIEAYGVKLDIDVDKEDIEKLEKGELNVSEHPKAVDIIMLILSTPEKNEMIVYEVDCENKTIGEQFTSDEAKTMGGRFAGFFNWMQN